MALSKDFKNSPSVFLAPLGGLGEIGMNMMAFIHKGHCFLLDCGVSFPDPSLLGVDLVMPKIDSLREFKLKIDGLVLTHSHEDHIGSVAYLLPQLGFPDIYGTEFTLAMLEPRLKERGLLKKAKLFEIEPRKKFELSNFRFEPLRVTHSLVDCIGLGIESPQGLLVHTGDFKIDRTPNHGWEFDEKRFRELGDSGVRLFMSDSTNVESQGWSPPESELSESLQKLIGGIKTGKVIVTLFSSNIERLQILLDVAKKVGRRVFLCGRSMLGNAEIAQQTEHLKFDRDILLSPKELDRWPREKTLILSTGTQAEGRSALFRMATRSHPNVEIEEGDTVIFSSRHIPGNEKRIASLMNQIYRCRAKVIDSRDAFVHVSGHARRDELTAILEWVKPEFFLPVHGEYKMLCKHLELAEGLGFKGCVAENGDVVELGRSLSIRSERLAAGKLYLDENRNIVDEECIRERRKVASQGFLGIQLVIRKSDSKILFGPEIIRLGIPLDVDWVELEDEIQDILQDYRGRSDCDSEAIEEEIRLQSRRFVRRALGLKPTVIPSVYVV